MPIYTSKVTAGAQFTAASSADGLFAPRPGAPFIQVRVNSLRYHTAGPGNAVELHQQNPADPGDRTLILSTTAKDVYMDGLTLPTAGADAWPLVFITTGQTLDGWLSIDYDFIATEG